MVSRSPLPVQGLGRIARIMRVVIAPALLVVSLDARAAELKDPWQWLETLESPQVDAWIAEANARTEKSLTEDPRFQQLRSLALDAYQSGKLAAALPPLLTIDDFIYSIDTQAGFKLKRTSWQSYVSGKPEWSVAADYGAIAGREKQPFTMGRNYSEADATFRPLVCSDAAQEHCLLFLSRGGQDATEAREFDVATQSFVPGGFHLPEARSSALWVDRDTLLVGTGSPGSDALTSFKTPKTLRLWKRGTPLDAATVVLSADGQALGVSSRTIGWGRDKRIVLDRFLDFFRHEKFIWQPGREPTRLPLTVDDVLIGAVHGDLVVRLGQETAIGGKTVPQGSVVAVALKSLLKDGSLAASKVVWEVTPRQAVVNSTVLKDALYLVVLDDVAGQLVRAEPARGHWTRTRVPLPEMGTVRVRAYSPSAGELAVSYETLSVAPTMYLVAGRRPPKVLQKLPSLMDDANYVTERRFATSKDGTRIPYFIARPKKLIADGSAPTLLTGYGGFASSMLPAYIPTGHYFGPALVDVWGKAGGVYVTANLRGGSEYGPSWHRSVILENKQKTWDDFIAVAEDLIRTKVTSPRRLGIAGASHAGLLVGVALTQRPDLFSAVWSDVPGLDMLRYHKLFSSGAMAEYGDPDDPRMREVIRAYSPYQNVDPSRAYPAALFTTNRADDRVHPAHARKMYALMRTNGKDVYFYERLRGGHAGMTDGEGRAWWSALIATFFARNLVDP